MKKLLFFLILGNGLNAAAQQIRKDKVLHFGVGASIGGVTAYICEKTNLTDKKYETLFVCIGTSTAAAVGKELYDLHIKKTSINKRDILWTTIGGVVGGVSVSYTIQPKQNKFNPTFL
jgi:uncharacterized protein YfiM (DUF2279 family)